MPVSREINSSQFGQKMQRFIDEELLKPEQKAYVKGFPQSEGKTDFLPHLRWDGQGELSRRITRGQVKQQKQHQTDEKQGWYSQQGSSNSVVEHLARSELDIQGPTAQETQGLNPEPLA